MTSFFRDCLLAALAVSLGATAADASTQVMPPRHRAGDIYVGKSHRAYHERYAYSPGSDNRYFSDTENPSYPLGPAFDAYRGGFENVPEARPPF